MDPNNNHQEEIAAEKYRLRPRKRCGLEGGGLEAEEGDEDGWGACRRRRRGGGNPGGGTKSAPLSKYRRKTANARERSRMREINEAFDTLRRAVPAGGGGAERLTKISTLRLAMSYIAALSEVLASSQPQSPATCSSTTGLDSVDEMDDFDCFGPTSLDFDDFLAIDIT